MEQKPQIQPKYGDGSWYAVKDSNGEFQRWELLLFTGTTESGAKKRVKGTSRNPNELEAYVEARGRAEANKARALGLQPKKPKQKRAPGKPAPNWTIRQYAEHWLRHIEFLSEDRQHYHRQRLRDHILPYVGDMKIGEFSAHNSEHLFKNILVQKGLGGYGRSGVRKTLSQMFRHAREQEYPPLLFHHPIKGEHAPVPKGRKNDNEETDSIWKRANIAHKMLYEAKNADTGGHQPFLFLWLSLTFFGIRRAEISGLTWDKVSTAKNGTIKIHAQYLYRREWRGNRYTSDLKSSNGRREFPTSPHLQAALIMWRQEQERLKKQPGWQEQEHDYVLTHKDGRPFSGNDQNDYWTDYKQDFFKVNTELAKEADADNWVQHYNRHITASMFKDWGISYEDCRRILGHGDKAITEKIYTQTRPESLSKTIKNIGNWFQAESETVELELLGKQFKQG